MTPPLAPGEPAAGGWDVITPAAFAGRVQAASPDAPGRPVIVAVDGRSAAGKSTFAEQLTAALPHATLVHGDDLSWNEPMFAWEHLLRDDVLAPLRRGDGVAFTPPAWPAHGREGAVAMASGLSFVVVEGVGVSQRAVADLVDVAIWVQSDDGVAEERGLARDIAHGGNGDREESIAFWHWWLGYERPFLAADRPWERAAFIVAGNLGLDVSDGLIAVAPGPLTVTVRGAS